MTTTPHIGLSDEEMREPITHPGRFDLSMQDYLGQPCEGPSISASDARILTDETPKHLQAHWRRERKLARKADLGTAIHALILEPARASSQIVIIDAPDFKTRAAKDDADEALAAGLTPLLKSDYDRASRARDAVLAMPACAALLTAGIAEQTYIACDPSGVWLKTRPDLVTADHRIVDFKTVSSCSPDFLARRQYDGGWFRQAAWQALVFERVMKHPASDYIWLCVEQEDPFDVTWQRPSDNAMAHGARLNDKAIAIFARCLETGEWPGYPSGTLDLPAFAYYRLEDDSLADEDRAPDMRAARIGADIDANPFG